MAAKQDNDDDIDAISDDMNDIDSLLESLETAGKGQVDTNLNARRRIEELLEERMLREQTRNYREVD